MRQTPHHQPRHINASDSIAIVGIALTIFCYALVPTLVVRISSVLFGLILGLVLLFRSELTKNWSGSHKLLSSVLFVLSIGGLSIFQLRSDWSASKAGGGVFKVSEQLLFINLSRRLDIQPKEWWFWVIYRSLYGETASPVPLILYVRITNLSDKPQTIDRYTVSMTTEQCGSFYLSPIQLTGPFEPVWVNKGEAHGEVADFATTGLEERLVQPIASGQTVGGWLFFDSRVSCDLAKGEKIQFRYTFRTNRGVEVEVKTEKQITDLNPQVGSTEGTNADSAEIHFLGKEADFSTFRRKRFSDPLQP